MITRQRLKREVIKVDELYRNLTITQQRMVNTIARREFEKKVSERKTPEQIILSVM
jgi:hypothetical protein